MAFCLPKFYTQKFLEALQDGRIQPEKLTEMTSAERRNFFKDIVGEADAAEVNALLESKLILKDQKRGMVTWAKQLAGLTPERRTDLISRIEKLSAPLDAVSQERFFEDLAAKRFGAEVSFDQIKQITDTVKEVTDAKNKIDHTSPDRSPSRMEYGTKYALFQDYIKEMKGAGKFLPFKEWLKHPITAVGGLLKSIVASLDNSFFGRQGWKTLIIAPDIWIKDFAKSWGDIAKELAGYDAMLPIKADIYSRDNALNGKYDMMGIDIGIKSEEAFPSAAPELIPLLGRLFKASESAFNGGALRMRADLADRLIQKADESGVNTLDRTEMAGIGHMINSMTGRGEGALVPKGESGQNLVNSAFFSVKFMQSNLNTLTMHLLDKKATPFVRRQAALNLTKIILAEAAIMTTANLLKPGSAETDPRGSGFGKIRSGATTFDFSAGMGGIVTLAARITPTKHGSKGGLFGDGWGFWKKDSKTGQFIDLTAGKYGQKNAMDVVNDFWGGKLSPLAGVVRDLWEGRTFQGQKPTLANEFFGATTPLSIQTSQDLLNNPQSAPFLGALILDGLGISTYTPPAPKKK